MGSALLDAILAEPVDHRFRAFGAPDPAPAIAEVGARGWSLPARDLPFPQLVLRESALAHNIATMHGWCRERGLALAPHGKTSMAPQLFARQLEAGAWGMTAANVHQAAIMRAAGAPRVLIANEVVAAGDVARLERERRADPGFEAFCLVDSEAGVEGLDAALAACDATRPLPVLVELGPRGGRTGARGQDEALAVARSVRGHARLALAGVEGWEGGLAHDRGEEAIARVDAFLEALRALVERLREGGAFETEEPIATAGGSAYFDRVAERLRFPSGDVRVILRSGCYLTHDHGLYERVSPLPELRAAFALWAEVLSVPEPGLAIAGFGKRDAPYDLGLPRPLRVLRGTPATPVADGMPMGLRVAELNDQHVFLRFDAGELRVGDLVVSGISHPCTAFDKWSLLPVVDDHDAVIGAVRTLF